MSKNINNNNEKMVRSCLEAVLDNMDDYKDMFVKNSGKDFTRNRKLSFKETIKLMLSMKGNTLNKELYEYFGKNPEEIMTTSAFVQQRNKLKEGTFEYLFESFNETMSGTKAYKGYKVYAVDGSDINIAYNPESDTYINPAIKVKQDGTEGRGHNLFHLNAIYDIMNKVYVKANVQPKQKADERRAFLDMVKEMSFEENTVFVADRGYPSWNLFATFNEIPNADYLVRVPNEFNNFIKELPMKELDIVRDIVITTSQKEARKGYSSQGRSYVFLQQKKNKMKNRDYYGTTRNSNWDFGDRYEMQIRILRFKISDDTYETIITSLPRFRFSLENIKELYGMRWGIETSFRELKYISGLLNLHSRKEEYVLQEIYARLTMYNFCERVLSGVVVEQDAGRKYEYQVNFTMGFQICMDFFRGLVDVDNLYELILKYIVAIRPGRSDKRKLKPKTFVGFLYRVA